MRTPKPFLNTPHPEFPYGVSPDGTWVTYVSDESGQREIYARPVAGGGKFQVSVGGGHSGRFASGGREIVYRNGTKYYAVDVQTAPQFRAGKPKLLFDSPYKDSWAPMPDGRLLVIKEGPPPTTTQLQIVLNWADELKRRVTQ